ncbi:DUF6252 family protein [Flavobacterium sp. 102]|uniref:DUF6252 family protein n=1 Tax=Flavobacterium sp. 102 TaxID=2135623 RepID=UPI000EAF1731|nr:DUF6252 family protein [Flavobacterium sp. 102]RKS00551.1 hypothetical protein C8C84_0168 [Flavobacterium sp. 102]
MKTIKQFGIVLTVALATLLSSCSGSDDGGGGGGNASLGQVKAKVAGSSFSSMEVATFAQKIVAGGTTTIIVQGSTAQGKAIQLILNGTNGQPGTFEISDDAAISAVASYTELNQSNPMNSPTWAAPYEDSGVVGSITISEISDTNVKGTFNFTGKNQNGTDTKAVTNGAFNVNFQN